MSTNISTPPGTAAVKQKKRKARTLAGRDALWGYLFISPQLIGFLVFVVGPLIAVIVFSTQDRNLLFGTATPVGLDNYRTLLTGDTLFWQVMQNTLYFSLLLVPLNIVVALGGVLQRLRYYAVPVRVVLGVRVNLAVLGRWSCRRR